MAIPCPCRPKYTKEAGNFGIMSDRRNEQPDVHRETMKILTDTSRILRFHAVFS
jgi:hypothetical protein